MVTLGRVRGVPIMVSPSWFLIGVLVTLVYGPVLDDAVAGLGSGPAYLAAAGFSVLFALCILAHELGHTMVSTALGYPVKRVVLFVLGGVSEIEGEPRRARHELAIAASGPLVSVAVAGAAFGGVALTGSGTLAEVLFGLLAWSNLVLAAFNLLPGLPLDGGRVLRAVVWGFGASVTTATRIAAWVGRVVAVALAALSFAWPSGDEAIAASALSVFLALYLWVGATQSLRAATVLARLPDVSVERLLRPGVMVPADVPVSEALRRVWDSQARGLVVVDRDGRPTGIVDEQRVAGVPPERRAWIPIGDVARPLTDDTTLPSGLDARGLLDRVQAHPATEYLVVDGDGRPSGIIATVDFAAQLNPRVAR